MTKIKYVGPNDQVQIAATGQMVEQGETVDVEDAGLARSLLEQTDNWQRVKKEQTET